LRVGRTVSVFDAASMLGFRVKVTIGFIVS
jgi:hypothetical protein